MPTVIRQALSERIRRLPELQALLRDLSQVAGVNVDFATALGHREPRRAVGTVCHLLHQTPGGLRTCQSVVQRMLEKTSTSGAQCRCSVGLWESAVPLRTGGHILGYLMYGGYFAKPPGPAERQKIREVLNRAGASADDDAIREACARSPCMDQARRDALSRVMAIAAEHLVASITHHIVAPGADFPRLVRLTCEKVRQTFTHEVSLAKIARELSVTPSHLCRIFHQTTGLRFREYVARLRAEHAQELLLKGDTPITEIAFAAGFQSLSQFNRVLHRVYGVSARSMRTKTKKRRQPTNTRKRSITGSSR